MCNITNVCLEASQAAALCGKLKCIIKCKHVDNSASFIAAGKGHLHILKYLYSVGYKWPKGLVNVAIEFGHLECIKFLHQSGCDWEEDSLKKCIQFGHYDCFIFLMQNGAPLVPSSFDELIYTRSKKCQSILKF